ncbi:MAG: hypothetical protein H0V82_04825 [Candidatus Protochlamydia sp.]|nr:hypothetical protein [Candidatus Protochlamydia sp.]
MFEYELYLAFPITPSFEKKLSSLNDTVRNLFIQSGNFLYLQEITYADNIYLGKNLGQMTEVKALESFQDHLLSLLKKLVPDYPYSKNSFVLLAIPS